MLRLREVISERPVSIKVEDYVPLRATFQPRVTSIDEAFYWRSTNSNYLLEIEVHASDGALADVGVVLVPQERFIRVPSLQKAYATGVVKKGLPSFDITLWTDKLVSKDIGIDSRSRRNDENYPFKFFVANDGVAVLLDAVIPAYAVQNGSIEFAFNSDDELCGFSVRDSKAGRDANRLLRGE